MEGSGLPYEEIIAALDEEIEANPYNRAAMINTMEHLIALDSYNGAPKVAEKVAELNPKIVLHG